MRYTTTSLAFFTLLAAAAAQASEPAGDCEAMKTRSVFENTTVTSAVRQPANAGINRPAFCEVTATAKPVAGSNITIVVRLPDNWNGKMLGSGGGGWAGSIALGGSQNGPAGATPGLVAGYAVVQTNSGHDVTNVWDTAWSSNPEAVTDFSHRAIHVMTDVGKAVVASYYGSPHKRAYFEGCSTGGRQALMEVQRYPNDYDGVISGAPVYTLTVQTMSVVRNQAFGRVDKPLTEAQIKKLGRTMIAACDGRDGLVDGVITDPRTCELDPGVLQCGSSGDHGEENCLTPKQVRVLRTLYSGVKSSAGETVSYPLLKGSEDSWSRYISAAKLPTDEDYNTGTAGAGLGGLRPLLFGDANFKLAAFNPDKDYRTVRDSAFAAGYEAKDPDISAFVNRGGKLLLWHGMLDPGPSAIATAEYFAQVKKTTGPKVKALEDNARFFMLPGVYHCRGGPGADQFDAVAAIDAWVERAQPPVNVIATKRDAGFARPLCEYPALPRYKGKGEPNAAESFACR